MKYLKGTTFQAWCLYTETQKNGVRRPVIKRWVTYPSGHKKCERLPTAQYAHFRSHPEKMSSFLLRLNADHRAQEVAKKSVAVKHAYIDDELLERYRRQRAQAVPSKDRVSTELYYVKTHFIRFFVAQLNLNRPQDWYRVHKDAWADYLLNDPRVPKAPATKREIIQSANRFMAWLHEERPTEVPELVFTPISTARFRDLNARRAIDPNVKKRTYIRPEHWKEIVKSLPEELEAFVMLAYHYGLRRSETLGVLPGDVKKDYLFAQRQLEAITPEVSYKPLKGKKLRPVMHWSCKASEAYRWVAMVQKYRMDPDRLTELWNDLMAALGYSYDFHEPRHTWVTRMLKEHPSREVQAGAGHENPRTTDRYTHNDQELGDEEFKPDSAA